MLFHKYAVSLFPPSFSKELLSKVLFLIQLCLYDLNLRMLLQKKRVGTLVFLQKLREYICTETSYHISFRLNYQLVNI